MSGARQDGALAHRYGPWALVTGASDGIGQAFAHALARQGLRLVLVARREERLRALAQELEADCGCETRVLAADLATEAGVRTVIEGSRSLDVGLLVACAGFGTSGPLLDGDLAQEEAMWAVNCGSVLQLLYHVGQRMRATRTEAGVVLMSSLFAFQGVPRAAHYAATKAYIQTLAEGLAGEWRPAGIRVVACAPGPIHSGFAQRAGLRLAFAQSPAVVARGALAALDRAGTVRPGWLAKLLEWTLSPLPRPARTRILARIVAGMTAHQDAG